MTVDRRGFVKLFGAAGATLALSRSTGLTETLPPVEPPKGFTETEPGHVHNLAAIDGAGVQHDLTESVITFDIQKRLSGPVDGPPGDGCLYGRMVPSVEGFDIKVLSNEPIPSSVSAFYFVQNFFSEQGSFGSLFPVQHATRVTKTIDWYGGMEIELGDYGEEDPISWTSGAMRGKPVEMCANWFRTTGATKLPDRCYPDTMPWEASEVAEAAMWSQWKIG